MNANSPKKTTAPKKTSRATTRRKPRQEVDSEFLELSDHRIHEPQRVAVASHGMISTAHYGATAAGVEVLSDGGNAVDAAVAAAFALGVCEPAASGLGGQTMMLIHHAATGRTIALDGSSRAPNRANIEEFRNLRAERRRGHRATTVPSTPAVLEYALRTYGKLALPRILEPSIRLAEKGYEVSVLQYRLTRRELKYLRDSSAAPFFLRDARNAWRAGSTFRQPVLAETLRRLAKRGVEDFYQGEMARSIEKDMERNGGFLRMDDLSQIPWPVERNPLSGRFQGHRVFTMPPPGAGRTLIEMMNIYQHLPKPMQNIDSKLGAVLFAETIRRAFLDRRDRPFDPNLYSQVTEKTMLSARYATRVAHQIRERIVGKGETTHLSAMDHEGNVVALTQSIENVYGSCEANPDLGFLYNNYLSAFEYSDMSHPYYLRPNAVPWASVAPTIVFRGDRPWLTIGSPGSERITSSILQVLIRLGKTSPLAAVDAPRLHCSVNGRVSLEASRMRSDLPDALQRHGFEVNLLEPYSFYLGCVQLVAHQDGEYIGVADPRRDGAAGGVNG